MTPRPSLIGRLSASRWFGEPWRRRTIVAIVFVLLALLSLFPREYRAASTMTPTDPGSAGLGGALGQLGAFAGLLGQQQAIEVNLKVARSIAVRGIVIDKLDLIKRKGFANRVDADRWMERTVDVRALRGGIMQIEYKDHDPDLAQALVATYTEAIRSRLAQLTRAQTAYKRQILLELVGEASDRLARAQNAYDSFRRNTRFSEPGSALGAIGARIPSLQAQLKAMEVELRAARAFATDNNIAVRQLLAQMDAVREQLQQAENLQRPNDPNSINRVVTQTTQFQRIQRELSIAQGLYDSYQRFLEGTTLEDMTSTATIRVLEPAYVDTALQFNTLPAALAILVLGLGLAVEFYQFRPPVGAIRRTDELDREYA